ncbi:XdhC family protein [Escherichia coli]
MLVRDDGSIVGTIGGGMVERRVIDEALKARCMTNPLVCFMAGWRVPAAMPWGRTAAVRCRFISAFTRLRPRTGVDWRRSRKTGLLLTVLHC